MNRTGCNPPIFTILHLGKNPPQNGCRLKICYFLKAPILRPPLSNSTRLFTKSTSCHYIKYWFSPDIDRNPQLAMPSTVQNFNRKKWTGWILSAGLDYGEEVLHQISQEFQPKTRLFEATICTASKMGGKRVLKRCRMLVFFIGRVYFLRVWGCPRNLTFGEPPPRKRCCHVGIHVVFSIHAWSPPSEKSWL
jgi:hypothetical protein